MAVHLSNRIGPGDPTNTNFAQAKKHVKNKQALACLLMHRLLNLYN